MMHNSSAAIPLYDPVLRAYWWAYKLAYANDSKINSDTYHHHFTTQTLATRMHTTMASLQPLLVGCPPEHRGACLDSELLHRTPPTHEVRVKSDTVLRLAQTVFDTRLLEINATDATVAHHVPAPDRPIQEFRLQPIEAMLAEWLALRPRIETMLREEESLIRRVYVVGKPDETPEQESQPPYPSHYITLSDDAYIAMAEALDEREPVNTERSWLPDGVMGQLEQQYTAFESEWQKLIPSESVRPVTPDRFVAWEFLADSLMHHAVASLPTPETETKRELVERLKKGPDLGKLRRELVSQFQKITGSNISTGRMADIANNPETVSLNLREAAGFAEVLGFDLLQWLLLIKRDYYQNVYLPWQEGNQDA